MKFVYVVVSSTEDYVAEQALLSLFSLKKHNPEAKVTIVLDKETLDNLDGHRRDIIGYADETIIADIPDGLLPTQRSRHIKTRLRPLVKGDFLYLDSDTVITGSLQSLKNLECHVGAVLNRHINIWNKNHRHPMLDEYYAMTNVRPEEDERIEWFFNGGVFYSRDTGPSRRFFETWHEKWLHSSLNLGFHKDQPDMWRANLQCGNIIEPIHGIYNFQVIYPNQAMKYYSDARVFHYFSSIRWATHLKVKNDDFLATVRSNGINADAEETLENIKNDYLEGLEIIMDAERDNFNTPLVIAARNLSRKYPSLNRMARKVYRFFHRR